MDRKDKGNKFTGKKKFKVKGEDNFKKAVSQTSRKFIENQKTKQQPLPPEVYPIKSNASIFLCLYLSSVMSRLYLDVPVQYLYASSSFMGSIGLFLFALLFQFWREVSDKAIGILEAEDIIKKKKKQKTERTLASLLLILPISYTLYWVSCVILYDAEFLENMYLLAGGGFVLVWFLINLLEIVFDVPLERYDSYMPDKVGYKKVYLAITTVVITLLAHMLYIQVVVV